MTYPEGRTPITPDDMAKMHPSTWQQEVEQLRAENERLRAALRECVHVLSCVAFGDTGYTHGWAKKAEPIARAALGDDQ